MSKDYRKGYRVFFILFFLSFAANLFMLAMHLKDRMDLSSLLSQFSIRKWMKGREEAKGPQGIKIPKGMVLYPLIYVKNNEHFLLCEKRTKTLYLFRSEENGFAMIKAYPSIVGSNNVDKKKAGDLATPEGVYFFTSFLTGKSLPEKYGFGAFSLNYPNFLDQKEGKKGSGIWLHAYPDHLERPPFSEGCVVVRNEVLKELIGYIKPKDTPLVIIDILQYRSQENQQRLLQSLSHFLDDWETAWESRDAERYLRFYSKDFVSSDGKDYQRFKAYKHRVNGSKKFIQLQIEKISFLLSQKEEGGKAILRINQDYRSDNFNSFSQKILYLNEKEGGWKIVGEVAF